MLFTTKRKKLSQQIAIQISNHEISRVDHTKFLGVVIDDKLNWSYHINSIKNKIAKGIGVISKAKHADNFILCFHISLSTLWHYSMVKHL